MACSFVYLVAVVDWFSRRVMAWRLSIAMLAAFRVEALEETLVRYDRVTTKIGVRKIRIGTVRKQSELP
jgi:putative transposase